MTFREIFELNEFSPVVDDKIWRKSISIKNQITYRPNAEFDIDQEAYCCLLLRPIREDDTKQIENRIADFKVAFNMNDCAQIEKYLNTTEYRAMLQETYIRVLWNEKLVGFLEITPKTIHLIDDVMHLLDKKAE